ncbi:MAG: EfeM/EfeO family lipoprotein [Chloroflexus aggregans]|uniref:EfeM/EfeO family lipoprotein n=1 Tax=Chloroflexus aggregans TaxID=152260 RepID=A0A2J6XD61_9CHLR|nr:MAG: EfeM/EfeO family lipoprotein [Chloroflexus aggregans]
MIRLLRLNLVVGLLTLFSFSVGACSQASTPTPTVVTMTTDLTGIKTYLLEQTNALVITTAQLQTAANRYYDLAQTFGFDYATLWQQQTQAAMNVITTAREAWITASPIYEKMEGIVAGTPVLAQFDVDLDAGTAGDEDPANAVSFDLILPDGRVLSKPGNLFGVTESTLWGTEPAFTTAVPTDWNGNGVIEFGEILPDAQVLKASTDQLAVMASELNAAAQSWVPTERDAFTALVVMVPTMSEYFASWRDSRFVLGEATTQRDFNVISRLADIQDILSGLEIVYTQIRPRVAMVDPVQAEQIAIGLRDLKAFVADIYTQERNGRRFTPEEADILGAEAQNRATAITGQISQVAGALGIPITE